MIIATDLDGTLLDSNKKVGLQEQEWLIEFLQKGNVLAILTSRNLQDVKKCISWAFEIKDCKRYIGFDEGARLMLPDGSIADMPEMSIDQVCTVIEKARDQIDGFTAFYKGGHYDVVFTGMKLAELIVKGFLKGEKAERYCSLKGFTGKTDERFWKIKPVLKNKDAFPVYEQLRQFLPDVCVTLNEGRIEIMHGESGKLAALKQICSNENFPLSDVIYFGDEGNDLYCLESTRSFAMGNAPEWIKKAAKQITDTNDNKGVYRILQTIVV